ncbi:MAG: hypothetical protein ACTSRE_12745 [Promethearchaeota archaeon]
MDEVLREDMDKITTFLQKEIDAQAIILCGSRSVGDYKENSDWDMKVLTTKNFEFSPHLEGYDLEISCHNPNINFSFEEFGWKLRFCEVILDTTNKDAHRIVKEAHQYYKNGPKSWSLNYAITRQDKIRRYEKKFADCIKHEKWFELHQRLNWHFLENSYTWWYGIRGEWEPRPQNLMQDLKKRDPSFANILERITNPETSDLERVKLFQKLHKNYIASDVYQEFISVV